jgi:hypothetical protein
MARKVRVVRKNEVVGNGVALLQEAQGRAHGLLFANSAYRLMKAEMREMNLDYTVDETEVVEIRGKDTELPKVAYWGKDGLTGRIRIDYRVRMYTNGVGREVKGKRVSIVA